MQAMATPKRQVKAKRKPGAGRPSLDDPMVPITSFRGKRAFAEWFDRLAAHVRLPKAILLEHSLIEYARAHGFNEPAPER